MIQAVFWDYDNTILETEEAHWHKHQLALQEQGIVLEEKYRKRIYENNGSQNWQWMIQELGLKVPEKEYLTRIDAIFHARLVTFAFRPGVQELFQWFQQHKIPQGIVTNARRDSAEPVLIAKGLTRFMTLIVYKEDYPGRKPEPTPYLIALEKMGQLLGIVLEPGQCLAIEDDPKGVESAHLAGLKVIHRKLRKEDPASSYADYCCYSALDFQKVAEASSLAP